MLEDSHTEVSQRCQPATAVRKTSLQFGLLCNSRLHPEALCLRKAATQDSRLNYIEQHAERIGLDAGRLDSVRVSAARSSPMGDTLELCARYADAASVEALVPRLVPLVRV